MADASIGLSKLGEDRRPAEKVWVLDDPRGGGSAQAIGIAERLGVPFRRIPLSWNWMANLTAFSRHGSLLGLASVGHREGEAYVGGAAGAHRRAFASASGPALTLSSGRRAAAVALWLKERFGSPLVHCSRPGLRATAFDLLVIPRHEQPVDAENALPVLGLPHRLSPLLLRQARMAWRERLAHLPRPCITLLVRGQHMRPAQANRLAQRVAAIAKQSGGSVLATTTPRTSAEVSAALAAGLAPSMHILYRTGEPGENPYQAFLAWADAIVVTGDSASMLSEACTTAAPVFIAMQELAGFSLRSLHDSLFDAGQIRPLSDDLSPWPRQPLDEAGRVATEIRSRFTLD
jgi:mitochondrial fission protein ELM1